MSISQTVTVFGIGDWATWQSNSPPRWGSRPWLSHAARIGRCTRFTQGELRLTRLAAFSDGGFAIIVTLLVLETKVPALQDHGSVQATRQVKVSGTGRCAGEATSERLR